VRVLEDAAATLAEATPISSEWLFVGAA